MLVNHTTKPVHHHALETFSYDTENIKPNNKAQDKTI